MYSEIIVVLLLQL